ncbi:16S rRNA (uracil(1498)-N(3))-methyltransferase [Alkaliphilus hydrothermalis]|uniref:Ribosomal RNA small subunit methyltransferase E n=1 Tax=Alkaliphilus hydrothermalis TaxID=1482730 RepID=A0ABS2NNY4_9FIRM|nr:16S rRNA (uracil(1498)-N(3))-methyltransferase [Alkaliphilus hydrothermalis]MBM7614658.1 16S rRNA (uracil1498-N3)-methyltransferase [Alkaliphilus hydrothermalis]
MNRFFVEASQINEATKEILIEGEDVKHISKVLRLSEGDNVEICDGISYEYIGRIKSIDKNNVFLSIVEKKGVEREAPVKITLYQGVPKATKMDIIIQKTTEMGIAEIVPVTTQRTVVQFHNDKDREKKTERWQKIAQEAAKQSKRGIIPKIHMPISFGEALEHGLKNQLNIMAYELEEEKGLKSLLLDEKYSGVKEIGIWVGPEGGYSETEVADGLKEGLKSITLGPRILRTETAGFALLSMIMYEIGDLGGF